MAGRSRGSVRRGCPYAAAMAQLGGDMDGVQAALTLRGLGARGHRARQRMALLRGRSYTGAGPHGLTRRQSEVLDLLAARSQRHRDHCGAVSQPTRGQQSCRCDPSQAWRQQPRISRCLSQTASLALTAYPSTHG